MILANSSSVIFGNNIIASNIYAGANNMWSSYDYKAMVEFYNINYLGETPKVNGVTLSLLDSGEYMDGTPDYNMNSDGVTATLVDCATTASGILLTRLNYDDTQQSGIVTSIGDQALKNCEYITNVAIRKQIITIGNNSFFGCLRLKTVFFEQNSNLTEIKSYAFSNCQSLHTVEIPSAVTDIGEQAFSYTNNLKRINCYAQSAPNLGEFVFLNSGSNTINVPVGATGYGTTYGGLTVNYSL